MSDINTLASRFSILVDHFGGGVKARFSNVVGIERGKIGNYVNGSSLPSADTLVAISKLGVSIDWLLTGRGTMLAGGDADQVGRATADEDVPDIIAAVGVSLLLGFFPFLSEKEAEAYMAARFRSWRGRSYSAQDFERASEKIHKYRTQAGNSTPRDK